VSLSATPHTLAAQFVALQGLDHNKNGFQGYGSRLSNQELLEQWTESIMPADSYDVVEYVKAGSFFGERGILGRTWSSSVVCVEPAELLSLARQDLLGIIRKYPHYIEQLGLTVSSRDWWYYLCLVNLDFFL
jgi:hypothetical protein